VAITPAAEGGTPADDNLTKSSPSAAELAAAAVAVIWALVLGMCVLIVFAGCEWCAEWVASKWWQDDLPTHIRFSFQFVGWAAAVRVACFALGDVMDHLGIPRPRLRARHRSTDQDGMRSSRSGSHNRTRSRDEEKPQP